MDELTEDYFRASLRQIRLNQCQILHLVIGIARRLGEDQTEAVVEHLKNEFERLSIEIVG